MLSKSRGKIFQAVQACVGHGTDDRKHPKHYDHMLHVGLCGDRLDFQRMHHRQVSLSTKGCHIEHRRKAHCLKEKRLEVTAFQAQEERVVIPHLIQLQGHAQQKYQQVGHCQAEEIVIGGCLHDPVVRDDCAGEHIAKDTCHKDEQVGGTHRYEKWGAAWAQVLLKVLVAA